MSSTELLVVANQSDGLTLACAALNIQLLHRPPRDPPAGGLIERFFRTNQEQLEAEVRATHLLTLDDLNRVLAAWLETAYHARPHSETKQTPFDAAHRLDGYHACTGPNRTIHLGPFARERHPTDEPAS
ncbi:MAG: hypothetical protein ACYC96_17000, partial [Fimbriimonadaceae bacterium]